jgi:hypothetical protein
MSHLYDGNQAIQVVDCRANFQLEEQMVTFPTLAVSHAYYVPEHTRTEHGRLYRASCPARLCRCWRLARLQLASASLTPQGS